jgi:hypothetical protein
MKNPFYDDNDFMDNDFMASLFYLDHPDFTLIPPLDEGNHKGGQTPHSNSESNSNGGLPESKSNFQDATASWLGVAKTQEGITALLALRGTPLDDPEHPLCLFSWEPTQDALEALHAQAKEATFVSLSNPEAHRAQWAAHGNTAWLTRPEHGTVITLAVPKDIIAMSTLTASNGASLSLPVYKGASPTETEPLHVCVNHTGEGSELVFTRHDRKVRIHRNLNEMPHLRSFLWEKGTTLGVPPFPAFCFSREDAQRLRTVMLSSFDRRALAPPPVFEKAYFAALTHAFFVRNVRAFFENQASMPRAPGTFGTKWLTDFRAIAKTYDSATQRAAWSWAHKKNPH